MSDWHRHDFVAANNATWFTAFQIGGATASWTLSDATVRMEIRPFPGHPDVILLIESGDRLTVESAETRAVSIVVPLEVMKAMIPTLYHYDILVTTAGETRRRQYGTLTVIEGVTAPA